MPIRFVLLAAALVLSGCLPSSGKRQDTALLPADSTSRVLAATVVPDTLAQLWRAEAPADDPLLLPMTVTWVGERLAVLDTQASRLRWVSADGVFSDGVAFPEQSFPYSAGAVGDTLGVLLRGEDTIVWIADGAEVRRLSVPTGAQAALVRGDSAVVRLGGGATGAPPELVALSADGAVGRRTALLGPAWRSIGFLRAWGEDVLALSGYRPVVDVWAPAAAGRAPADTLALVGFDSPQLRRSAQFVRGDADEPPLLIPSAAALGDRLYVLNARADELRIDVYDRRGALTGVWVNPGRRGPLDLISFDLAARRVAGGVELAVLWQRPRGLLRAAGSAVEVFRIDDAPERGTAAAGGR